MSYAAVGWVPSFVTNWFTSWYTVHDGKKYLAPRRMTSGDATYWLLDVKEQNWNVQPQPKLYEKRGTSWVYVRG